MLSNVGILHHMQQGNIVISPFDEAQLGTNSYDVRLGNWIVRQKLSIGEVRYNSREGAYLMWEDPVKVMESFKILPGETILAHTLEVIGGRNFVTTEMRAKSTVARFGVSVCKCAGLGDVGFVCRWTMEMTNHSDHGIVFQPGDRVAQILFHNVGQVTSSYGKLTGRYGQGTWSPEDMLPKGQL